MLLRRWFAGRAPAKQVTRVGVHLIENKPLDVYDLRKIIFGKLVALEKKIPLVAYFHSDPQGDQTALETNMNILDKLEFGFDNKITLKESEMQSQIEDALKKLEEGDRIRRRNDGCINFKMSSKLVNMKDMRVGQFDYDVSKTLESPIFIIKKQSGYTPNFLFAAHPEEKGDLVLIENEGDFLQSVYKTVIEEALGSTTNRFLHLNLITAKTGSELKRSHFVHLDTLLNKNGIDKLALISYVGNLGYKYSEGAQITDVYTELQTKMRSFKQMSEDFKVDLIEAGDSLFAHEQLLQMNRFFFRNRVRAINKPGQRVYLEKLIRDWGGPKMLRSVKNRDNELDPILIKEYLWDIRKYSELQQLGTIYTFNPEDAEKCSDAVTERLSDKEMLEALKGLKNDATRYFQNEPFDKPSIGKLFSTVVQTSRQPEKVMKGLEQVLFGYWDQLGPVIKARMIGKEAFLERVDSAVKASLKNTSKS